MKPFADTDLSGLPHSSQGAGRAVPHVGTMTRTLPVSIERLYENALDWEHLPWLHSSTFSGLERISDGDWGWRVRASLTDTSPKVFVELELRLDREARRWITTTLDGPGTGSETWTHAFEVGELETYIVIDFFSPGLEEGRREEAALVLTALYNRLYDEDVAMMTDRQTGLDGRGRRSKQIGSLVVVRVEADVRASLPRAVEAFGTQWRIVEVGGELLAHAARCPHRLGALTDAATEGTEVVCPWHGYRFDIETGDCVSGARCKLPPAPDVRLEEGRVVLSFAPQLAPVDGKELLAARRRIRRCARTSDAP